MKTQTINRPRPKVKNTLMKIAKKHCDKRKMSVELTINYIKKYANVDSDMVVEFLRKQELIEV